MRSYRLEGLCGAETRYTDQPCRHPAGPDGRCRFHPRAREGAPDKPIVSARLPRWAWPDGEAYQYEHDFEMELAGIAAGEFF